MYIFNAVCKNNNLITMSSHSPSTTVITQVIPFPKTKLPYFERTNTILKQLTFM